MKTAHLPVNHTNKLPCLFDRKSAQKWHSESESWEDCAAKINRLAELPLKSTLTQTPLSLFISEWKKNSSTRLGCEGILRLSSLEDLNGFNELNERGFGVDSDSLQNLQSRTESGGRYIFIDYSNITAQLVSIERTHPIIPAGLSSILERGKSYKDKVISASFPSSEHPVWTEWRSLGYRTRVSGSRGGKEVFVDDSLHAGIFKVILSSRTPGTLILVTGDGNTNNGYSSFPEVIKTCFNNSSRRTTKFLLLITHFYSVLNVR
jgi:hypothetical protein